MRLGFLINPIAGMGGAVGLKGTDGDALTHAIAKGAAPIAPAKAEQALSELQPLAGELEILAGHGVLGADLAAASGFAVTPVGLPVDGATDARHTRAAMRDFCAAGVDLVLFVGGDGSARDILAASETAAPPVIGAPSGVKMHSGVFAASARSAGALARRFLIAPRRDAMLRNVEIVDRPDTENGQHSEPQCFGVMHAPHAPFATPHPKASSLAAPEHAVAGALREIEAHKRDGEALIVGPGATMAAVKISLGAPGALLGVDVFRNGRLIAGDADRDTLLAIAESGPARIVVSPTGGQGFLFGRGNQQIDASVIRAVGVENILIVSALEKLLALETGALFVDTGDAALNAELSGYARIVTGPRRRTMFRIVNPDDHLNAD